MTCLLSIDPGGKSTGYAFWEGRVLRECGRSVSKSKLVTARARDHRSFLEAKGYYEICSVVVCERMSFRYGKNKCDPQDLIDLNLISGHLATSWVTPSEWKGKVSKEIHQPRILLRLSKDERKLVDTYKCSKKDRLDMIDAIGVGLVALGRWNLGE